MLGYYLPYARDIINPHCLTTLTFGGTAIKESNLKNVSSFIDNLLDGTGTPLRVVEVAQVKQEAFPGFLGGLINPILASLGY